MNIPPASITRLNSLIPVPASARTTPLDTLPETKSTLSTKEAAAKAFYTREDQPWLNRPYRYTDHTQPEVKTEIRSMTKQEYIEDAYAWSGLMSRIESDHLSKFRNELMELRPDLAGINFSYTLGDDAELKIINLDGKLGEHELKFLTDAINKKTDFKEAAREHAKIIMTLVDHDTETFRETLIYSKTQLLPPDKSRPPERCRDEKSNKSAPP
ncbi:hypothetical protein [Pseudomonas cannabina]|uniref:hypothetical protein n=2 Tax=Pseudomonas cannabina TaxID=86840 RepID=UPI00088A6AA5|nr:hypothetical protein [Pseudomonas cannabina]SDR24900.1 hypothetical protein SAMN05216597_3065 [Pseudomonas cannabina]